VADEPEADISRPAPESADPLVARDAASVASPHIRDGLAAEDPELPTRTAHRSPSPRPAGLWRRPSRNVAALDGMRALATAGVVLFHCALLSGVAPVTSSASGLTLFQQWLDRLWTGVDVFFVLSGFLVGRILFEGARQEGHLPYRSFWIRRAFRIFPAYYFVLLASLVSIRWLGGPVTRLWTGGDWRELVAHSWSNFLYVNNYASVKKPDIMSWGWSLCVEEHFYLLLPLVLSPIVRVRSDSTRLALLVCVTLLGVVTRTVEYLGGSTIEVIHYSHSRFDELFLGVVVAYLHVSRAEWMRRISQRCGSALWIAGVACIFAVWAFGGTKNLFGWVWQFLVIALGAALLIVNGLYLSNAATRLLSHWSLYPLARVSYGMYLLHPFVIFVLLDRQFLVHGDLDRSVAGLFPFYGEVMVLTSLAAAGLYLFVERPCLTLGTKLGGQI
jgi:peptidoglycan/LPS O-acetylase OafA/YrhL